jgi:tetratricopeptide (TPR) repeat protein
MAALGYPKDSMDIIQQGMRLAEEIGDTGHLARFHNWMASYYQHKGNPQMSIRHCEMSLQFSEKSKERDIMSATAAMLCMAYDSSGDFVKCVDVARKMIDEIKATGREDKFFGTLVSLYSHFCGYCGVSMAFLGNFEEGERYCSEALQEATKIGNLINLMAWELANARFFLLKANAKESLDHSLKCIEYCKKTNWPFMLSAASTMFGYGHYLLGDFHAAISSLKNGLRIRSETAIAAHASLYHCQVSMVHYDRQDLEEAYRHVKKAIELSTANSEKHHEGLSRIWFGRILAKKDHMQMDGAEESFLRGIRILEDIQVRPWASEGYLLLGEFYSDRGEREKALHNIRKAESMFQEMDMDYWVARTHAVLADWHRKWGEESEGRTYLEKAIGAFRDLGADGWAKKYEAELPRS